MTLPRTRSDREYLKFEEDGSGNVALRTTATLSGDIDVSAFELEAGTDVNAKTNDNQILVVQTGSGADSSALTEQIATETTLAAIELLNTDIVTATEAIQASVEASDDAFDVVTNSNRITNVSPLNLQYVTETLLDLTDIDENTTGYGYIEMNGFRTLAIQGVTSGATPTDVLTVTFEATCQDDGTALASCAWTDVTAVIASAANFVNVDFFEILDSPLPVRALRVKYVTSEAGGDDCDLTVYTKKLY